MMFSISNCLILATVATLSATSEFSLKGDPCAPSDSCQSKSPTKTCSCKPDCHSYGTCCQDFVGKAGPSYVCYDKRPATPVFVKRACSDDFRGNVLDRLACHDEDEDEMDVRNNLLVTSRRTNVTYWNRHCAACNSEVRGDLEYWNIEVFCPKREGVESDTIRTNLTFDEDKRRWGLVIGGEFLNCAVRYAPSLYVKEVKLCTPNMISSCPEDYSNDKVSSKCPLYYAERRAKGSHLHFRNIHCAICNNADIRQLECPGIDVPEETDFEDTDSGDVVEEVFTDGEWLDQKYRCSKGFSYDPGRERCRRYGTLLPETATVQNSAHSYGKLWFASVVVSLPFIL